MVVEIFFNREQARLQHERVERRFRQQQIDDSKMPPYDAVRRYLGPAGAYVKSEANGWVVVGCVLTKEAPAIEEAKDAADQPTSE